MNLQRAERRGIFVSVRWVLIGLAVAWSLPAQVRGQGPLGYASQLPQHIVSAQELVTFNQHIAKIVHRKCRHRPGQAGPLSLVTFKEVAKRARTMDAVIDSGYMPPWKPVNDHVEFQNDRRLTSEEKRLLKRWILGGMPRGMGEAPKLPEFPDGWQLGKPDLVVTMASGKFVVPASGPDIYRSFVFPINLPKDQWIKAIEFRPTAMRSVHHALFFVDEFQNARQMDGKDGKPGISGMAFLGGRRTIEKKGTSKSRLQALREMMEQMRKVQSVEVAPPASNALSRGLGAYVPGWTATKLPGDLAMFLPRGSDIVMQTHFHPSGKREAENGKIAIYFAKSPPSKRIVPIQIPAMFGIGVGLKVPAGKSDYRVSESFKVPVDIDLISIGAHAHYICRKAKMTAIRPNGRKSVLLQIDDWDLDWQDRYFFKKPLRIPAGTTLTTELIYDNSSNNPENPNHPPREIRWGRESGDEMGSVTVQVVAAKESERPMLQASLRKYFLRSMTQGNMVDLLMQLDTNRDGGLQKSEAPARMSQRFHLLDQNGDGSLDRRELEFIGRLMSQPLFRKLRGTDQ